MMARIRRGIPAVIILLLAVCTNCHAAVIVDSFDLDGDFDRSRGWIAASFGLTFPSGFRTRRLAVQFSVAGSDYELSSVTLPIRANSRAIDNARLRITDDDGGSPGETLEILSENESIWPMGPNHAVPTTTVLSSANPVLEDGKNYWLILEPTELAFGGFDSYYEYFWFHNTTGVESPFILQSSGTVLPTDPWPPPFSGFPTDNFAFRVEGTVVPEPTNFSLCVTVLWFASRIRSKRD